MSDFFDSILGQSVRNAKLVLSLEKLRENPPRRIAASTAADYSVQPLEDRRMLNAGQLDPTFHFTGKLSDPILPFTPSVAVQSDGKIVTIGTVAGDFEIARFNVDGTVDANFGQFGHVITDLGGVEVATAVTVEPNGKILVLGNSDNNFAMVRYRPDGKLDKTFGVKGIVKTDYGTNGFAEVMGVRADGKIVVGGEVDGSAPFRAIALGRYNDDGTIDSTFGMGGKSITTVTFGTTVTAMAFAPDGKIIIAGHNQHTNELNPFMRRFNEDGSIQSNFIVPEVGNLADIEINGVTVQPDGKVIAVGDGYEFTYHTILLRYNVDTTPDVSFGLNGVVDETTDPGFFAEGYFGVVVETGGRIAVGGFAIEQANMNHFQFMVARYQNNGAPDATYGTGGRTLANVDNNPSRGVAFSTDGKTILAGGVNAELDIARFGADGIVPGIEIPWSFPEPVITDRIEVENFDIGPADVAYHSSNLLNFTHNLYRTSGVTVENSLDTDGGYDVGYLHTRDYMKYSVQVEKSGNYNFACRVANSAAGGKFHLEVDGVNVTGEMVVPNTGSLQVYETVKRKAIHMVAGMHILKLVMDDTSAGGVSGSFNWMTFNPVPTDSISGQVYNDANGNGTLDSTEVGIGGRKVYLDVLGLGHFATGDPFRITDIEGNYMFNNLAPGTYEIRIVPAINSIQTEPQFGGFWTVQGGGTVVNKNFGFVLFGV